MVDLYKLVLKIKRNEFNSIEFYGYRKAHIKTILVELDLSENKKYYDLLMDALVEKSNAIKDNHVTFKLNTDDGDIIMRFDDYNIIIGLGLLKGDW